MSMNTSITAVLAFALAANASGSETLRLFVPPPKGADIQSKLEKNDPAAEKVRQALGGLGQPPVSDVYRIESQSLRTLLPNWQFFRVNAVLGGAEKQGPRALALVRMTVALSDKDSVILPQSGDCREFGDLLVAAGVRIKTEEQQADVGRAFSTLYQRNASIPDRARITEGVLQMKDRSGGVILNFEINGEGKVVRAGTPARPR